MNIIRIFSRFFIITNLKYYLRESLKNNFVYTNSNSNSNSNNLTRYNIFDNNRIPMHLLINTIL